MPLDILPSVCPHDCPSACALEVERIDGNRIGRVHGARSQSYTAGVVCAKVARYAERQHHPDRLWQPLRRIGDKGVGRAAFPPISWDAALDEVAEALTRAAQRHGAQAVWPYYYAGTMGMVQRDGINRLRHAMGYSREDLTICNALADAGWLAGVGVKRGVDGREIAKADLIVVWGGNPVSTQVNVMTHVAAARRERGAKLVVIDPYRTASAEAADLHLAPLPGTDGALACAVMHVLFKEGYADRAYMARYADDPAGLEAHLAARDPAWAAAITGLSEDAIVDFARLYGRTRRSYIRVGYGFSRSRNGSAQLFAVTCLPSVTGAWQHEGGGALYSNHGLVSLDRTLVEGLDRLDPATRILDQSRIGPVLTGDRRDLGDGPPVTALFIQNTNPMVVAPESGLVRQGFARDDLFVCVHEQFMTETAAMADIVLPATTFLEHDDFYTAGGHTYLQLSRGDPAGPWRMPLEPRCGLRARASTRRLPPGVWAQRHRADRPDPAGERPAGGRGPPGRWLARLLSAVRDRALSRRLWPCRQEIPLPRRLGGARPRPRAAAALSRPCRGHRRRRPGAAVPPGRRPLALIFEHELQQHALGHRPRGKADGARPSGGVGRARHRRRRAGAHRQRQG